MAARPFLAVFYCWLNLLLFAPFLVCLGSVLRIRLSSNNISWFLGICYLASLTYFDGKSLIRKNYTMLLAKRTHDIMLPSKNQTHAPFSMASLLQGRTIIDGTTPQISNCHYTTMHKLTTTTCIVLLSSWALNYIHVTNSTLIDKYVSLLLLKPSLFTTASDSIMDILYNSVHNDVHSIFSLPHTLLLSLKPCIHIDIVILKMVNTSKCSQTRC